MEITINTPALLFPAITLLMLAYTTRFLALANLIRSLHAKFKEESGNKVLVIAQIKNLKIRIKLIKQMQTFGVFSIFLCVLSMFFIYINYIIMYFIDIFIHFIDYLIFVFTFEASKIKVQK